MKKLTWLMLCLLCVASLSLSSCKDEGEDPTPSENGLLQLDGDNVTAPNFTTGTEYETAAFYSSSVTAPFTGKKLTAIRVYLASLPDNLSLHVYSENTRNNNTSPGTELASKTVTGLRSAGQWVEITLDTPVDITGEGLWIGVRLSHSSNGAFIGCDAEGSKVNGGDWIARDGIWRTFESFANARINWNIRGVVE